MNSARSLGTIAAANSVGCRSSWRSLTNLVKASDRSTTCSPCKAPTRFSGPKMMFFIGILLSWRDQAIAFQHRIDAAAHHHRQKLLWHWLHLQCLSGAWVAGGPGIDVEIDRIAFLERCGYAAAFACQQPVVHRVAEEQAVDRLR